MKSVKELRIQTCHNPYIYAGKQKKIDIYVKHSCNSSRIYVASTNAYRTCSDAILRTLPTKLAGINLQHGLNSRNDDMKVYKQGEVARAFNSTSYGRIHDYRLVKAVQKIAGNGTGDTRWKIPGTIDWASALGGDVVRYNPNVDITKDSTTLYASDRDVFMFLVDDRNPIEIGKLANGMPDFVFRGFMAWNSETGSNTLGIRTFMLRGVCQNRNAWGVEGITELKIKHSKYAPERLAYEVLPILENYANSSSNGVLTKVINAKQAIISNNDEETIKFITDKTKLTVGQAKKVISLSLEEEGKKPESVWDIVQGITAYARDIKHTNERISIELEAGKLMAKV